MPCVPRVVLGPYLFVPARSDGIFSRRGPGPAVRPAAARCPCVVAPRKHSSRWSGPPPSRFPKSYADRKGLRARFTALFEFCVDTLFALFAFGFLLGAYYDPGLRLLIDEFDAVFSYNGRAVIQLACDLRCSVALKQDIVVIDKLADEVVVSIRCP